MLVIMEKGGSYRGEVLKESRPLGILIAFLFWLRLQAESFFSMEHLLCEGRL